MKATSSVNTLEAEIKLSNTGPTNFVDMTVTAPAAGQEPCLVFAACDYCAAEGGGCARIAKEYRRNATAVQEFNKHASALEYRCSLGKQFQDPFQRQRTLETNSMECDWRGIWQPSSQIWDCVCELVLG